MKLDYFQDGRFYNGLLSKQTWHHISSTGTPAGGDENSQTRTYSYDYDKANRYTNAIFSGSTTENYNENAAYDANGNILKLNRFGPSTSSGTTFSRIDSLTYSYSANSNRLNGITDLANNLKGHKDNGNAIDYTYYSDGSLKTDANKGITNIVYNYLGLQDEIQFGTSAKIKNIYTADGQKIIQYLINATDTLRTDYVGDLIYKNEVLETVFHDEGRINVALDTTINNWSDTLGNHYSDTTIALKTRYQYFIQDHLGNNRVIFEKLNDSLFVAQRVNYYPFGSPFNDSLTFAFTYQGKEYINFLGFDSYDFHARGLDTWTGRFSGVDPVNNYSLSGYASMANNPASYIDPDGREPISLTIIAGAAIIGGGANLWANWSKVKNWKQGVAYFTSGAAGGLTTVFTGGNAALGGAITSGFNVGIDVVGGHLPNLKTGSEIGTYALEQVAMGAIFGYAGGKLGQWVGKGIQSLTTYFQSGYVSNVAGSQLVNGELITWAGEAGVKATKVSVGNVIGQGIRQGVNFADDAGQGFSSMSKFKNVYGKAGQGQAWHHIVEQHADNIGKFGAESIYNTKNLIKLPEGAGSIHRKITGHYNSLIPGSSLRVRDYVKTLSFEEQYNYGINKLLELGWLPR